MDQFQGLGTEAVPQDRVRRLVRLDRLVHLGEALVVGLVSVEDLERVEDLPRGGQAGEALRERSPVVIVRRA